MLTPQEQRVMCLRARGHSLFHVAQRLGITYGAARQAAYTARKKLTSARPLSPLERVVLHCRERGWDCRKIANYLARTPNNIHQVSFRARRKLGI